MKKILSLLLSSICIMMAANAQQDTALVARYQNFRQVVDNEFFLDTLRLDDMLTKWEKDYPNDVELQSAKFQYLLKKALRDIEMAQDPLADNTAMLPAIPGLYENLQITAYWILQDKGKAMENYQKAYAILDKAIEEHPHRLDLRYRKMEGYMNKYEHRRGMLAALDILQLGRQPGWQWFALYDEPIEDRSEVESIVYESVSLLLEHNEISLAEIMVDSLLNDNPQSFKYREAKGLLLEQKMQPDSALQIYEQLYREAPDDAIILLRLADLHSRRNEKDKERFYVERLASNEDEEVAQFGRQLLSQFDPVMWKNDEVKQWMSEHDDEFKALQQRFIRGDETLTNQEIGLIYYGQAFTEKYNPLPFFGIKEALDEKDFEKCLSLCKESLGKFPAAVTTLLHGLISAQQMGDSEVLSNYALRFRQLTQMLLSIGDGKSIEKAIPVLWVDEEYAILAGAPGKLILQELLHQDGEQYDHLRYAIEEKHLAKSPTGEIETQTSTNDLDVYFNVTYSMQAMSKRLGK